MQKHENIMQVGISVLRLLLFVGRPKIYLMGKIQNSEIFRNIEQYPQATTLSGLIILHIDGPIYFANSSYLRDRFIIIYFIIIYQILAILTCITSINVVFMFNVLLELEGGSMRRKRNWERVKKTVYNTSYLI